MDSKIYIYIERERERRRVEDIMSAYGELMGNLFTSTVSQDSTLTSEHGCFYKHIYLRWTTHIRSGHQSIFLPTGDTGPFCFPAFVRNFRCLILRSSHFSFQCIMTTWSIDLSTCHSFPISTSLSHGLLSISYQSNLSDKIKRIFPSSGRVSSIIWMHYIDAD